MFRRLVMVSVLFGCAGLACGLRVDPESPDGGRGPAGEGGTAGSTVGRRGQSGGAGGSIGGSVGGSHRGHRRFGHGHRRHGPDVPVHAGGACMPANPCHVGQTTARRRRRVVHGHRDRAGERHRLRHEHGVQQRRVRACAAGHRLHARRTLCRTGAIVVRDGRARLHGERRQGERNVVRERDGLPGGQCVACQEGAACTPDESLSSGDARLRDRERPSAPTRGRTSRREPSCGTNKVCSATGVCSDCKVGASCTVTGKPCRTGATTCNTGAPVCTESGNVANGTTCGTNMVCSSGSCMACTAGLSCTPANPCHAGTQACSPRSRARTRAGTSPTGRPAGRTWSATTACAASCTAGASCQPSNHCKTGATSCVTGVAVCAETGNIANGTACGTNLVCNNGMCVACTAGDACTANPTFARPARRPARPADDLHQRQPTRRPAPAAARTWCATARASAAPARPELVHDEPEPAAGTARRRARRAR